MKGFTEQFTKEIAGRLVNEDPLDVALALADVVTHLAGKRYLTVQQYVDVLTESELKQLERIAEKQWFSAKGVWLALRQSAPYEHTVSINLGRQLSARYAKQRKQGPTRLYWIETPAITNA